ncbi:hypothetical protein tb265_34430 [Gemmatimonadetes bacterium T265]|nr:hypothetical protein tb265_34430 [Gemmatimonadetes bacterium T265]
MAPTPSPRPVAVVPEPPAVAREFRAVWVATVGNIDWPSKPGLSTAQQQGELRTILDRAASLHLNAIILQVRPAADALYDSPYEPWSEYLTGQMGRAPAPYYDPLAFAVAEAHRRGLELHAWFNPYRARQTGAKGPAAPTHVSVVHPEIVRAYAGYRWMDPGEAETRAQSLRVITDVVRRYDVDGVHIDDYFYPYPEDGPGGRPLPFPDSASYARYQAGGGALARDDWRRANVDAFVHAMYDSVHAAKPWVKVGISPFGIYRPKAPANACCFDAYAKLYADSRRWWREGWADYFTPQLYWKIAARQQSYPELLAWWAAQNVRGRNLWPGNYLSRVGTRASDWRVAEIDSQIVVTRAQPGAGGNVWFSMQTFLRNAAGVADSLRLGPYAEPALVPPSPWLPGNAPGAPVVAIARGARPHVTLDPAVGESEPWLWVVQLREGTRWDTVVLPGGAREYVPVRAAYAGGEAYGPDEVRAYGVDRTGRAGPATRAGNVGAARVASENR